MLLGRKVSHSRERREAGYLRGSDLVASCCLLSSFDSKVPSSSKCRRRMNHLFILTQFELNNIHINTESLSKAPLWPLKAKLITALHCSQVMIARLLWLTPGRRKATQMSWRNGLTAFAPSGMIAALWVIVFYKDSQLCCFSVWQSSFFRVFRKLWSR